MKIEIWSDFVCPFCYIGKRRLELALDQFPHKESVTIEFKSFELDPNAPVNTGEKIYEILASKYRMSVDQAKQACENMGQQASTVGLTFNFENMKPTNTFDAHRLAKFAKTKGKEAAMTEKLLFGYFTDSIDLSDFETLVSLAEAIGLDRQETLQVLQDSTAFANEVRADEGVAKQYQITGVPYFVINQKYAISGAQPTETFVNALKKVWEEEQSDQTLENLSVDQGKDECCADGNCMIPDNKQ